MTHPEQVNAVVEATTEENQQKFQALNLQDIGC